MPSVLVKTEAGSAEIRERGHALTRPARTLLLLADGTRSGEQLLGMVQGSSASDLALLLESGLLVESHGRSSRSASAAPAAAPSPASSGPVSVPPPAEPPSAADEPITALGYQELYDSLNALSKEQLGLFKGYKFALEIEKASGIDELRIVAQQLVEEVQKVKGDSAAQMVRRALGLRR